MSNENVKKDQTTPAASQNEASGFKIEKRSELHARKSVKQKLEGTRKIEITHGQIVCGAAVMDRETRGRQTEDLAHVGDRVVLSADEAAELVSLNVAKYIDQPAQT